MNNRSSVNETNLVNFSAELPTLNQLETKDGLLTFPFDHLYACHSDGSERRQTLQLDKEVEITTHCVITEEKPPVDPLEVAKLRDRLSNFERQNKALKGLIAYHLDLIQQQNEIVCKTEKLLNTVRQENETLKNRLTRADRRWTGQRPSLLPPPTPPPLYNPPPPAPVSTVTSKTAKSEPSTSAASPSKSPSSKEIQAEKARSPPPEAPKADAGTGEEDEEDEDCETMRNSYSGVVMPDSQSKSYVFDSERNKPPPYGILDEPVVLPKEPAPGEVAYLTDDLTISKLLHSTLNDSKTFSTMIDPTTKRAYNSKKDTPKTEKRPMYTVTSHSGNPVIQRVAKSRRRNNNTSSRLGSMNRMPKAKPAPKVETPETSKAFDDEKSYERFSVNKKSKMINTYGKSRVTNSRKMIDYSGSLCDRLRLIDTTPTGEDPYLLGEAEMRESSPIQKLMLPKTNHSRMKASTDKSVHKEPVRSYKSYKSEPKHPTDREYAQYQYCNSDLNEKDLKSVSPKTNPEEPETDVVKREPLLNWRAYAIKAKGKETSLCDFSYGETSTIMESNVLPSLDSEEFQTLFSPGSTLDLDTLSKELYSSGTVKTTTQEKTNKRIGCASNLLSSKAFEGGRAKSRLSLGSQPSRKRAYSTTGLMKTLKRETASKTVGTPRPKSGKGKGKTTKGKEIPPVETTEVAATSTADEAAAIDEAAAAAASRPKKPSVPGMTTQTPYHTLCGDPDVSWYLGLNPDVKVDDIEPPSSNAATVEVPRWREMPYTSISSLNGTESMDDKVFEKRHQKFEAEERRQLRWHMRRLREQRHMQRLRQRHRDSWCTSPTTTQPSVYTVWPNPRDARFIQITDTLPVMAFGEIVPALPESPFFLPWVRSSKAQKRSKRAKTLY